MFVISFIYSVSKNFRDVSDVYDDQDACDFLSMDVEQDARSLTFADCCWKDCDTKCRITKRRNTKWRKT
jgi:hypothetical protein